MLLSLPLLLLSLPLLFVLWYLFAPVTPVASPQRSVEVGEAKPGESRARRWASHPELVRRWDDEIETLPQLLASATEKFASRPALGARRTIKIEEKKVQSKGEDGQLVEKTHKIPWQTDFEWRTYAEVASEVTHLASGLMALELQSGQRVALFAATRPEWQIAAHALFRFSCPVVTIYPSLGVDALIYSLNQTSIQHIITQADKIDVLLEAASRVPTLKYFIFLDEVDAKKKAAWEAAHAKLVFISYQVLLRNGIEKPLVPQRQPKGTDCAVIMYTSGSTGNPKGVMISHSNLLAAAWSVMYVPPVPLNKDDTYIAYLPLAHVLEFAAETLFFGIGAKLGYSSPLTLQDAGVKNEKGEPCGDLSLLKPTVLAAVPLILDRFRTGVATQIKASPLPVRLLFSLAYYFKRRNYLRKKSSWLWDKLVFSKVRAKLGGRVRLLISGGAPLSPETQEFINLVFCVPVLQGFGLTETLAANCITHPDDVTYNNVGAPIPSCEVKLVDVPEMNYFTSEESKANAEKAEKAAAKSSSNGHENGEEKEEAASTEQKTFVCQGEIFIRGSCVSQGYFDNAEETAKSFLRPERSSSSSSSSSSSQSDTSDLPFFRTGDIGQWNADGTLSIIDRKKDLVKLKHGEYLALGHLESVYKHSKFVEHICIYADADHQRPIAIIVPHKHEVASMAPSFSDSALNSPALKKAVLSDLNEYGAKHKLEKWERIANVYLSSEEWTPASGLLTEAMKLKRHEIKKKYAKQIQETYKGVE